MRIASLAIMAATPLLYGAVEGVVLNRTLNRPQPNVIVTLYQPGPGGMKPLATARTSESGTFRFEEELQGPGVVQAIYQGVLYSQMAPASPGQRLELEVYEATDDPSIVRLAQHMMLFEPINEILHVSESLVFENTSNRALRNARRLTRLYLPPDRSGEPRVSITGPQGVPVERPLLPTGQENVYELDYPLRPGETRVDLTYVVKLGPNRTFQGKLLHGVETPLRLVAPAGVTLSGEGLTRLGQEPQTQATVYEIRARQFAVTITGSGSLRLAETPESQGPGVQEIPPRLYRRVGAILALAFLSLALAFLLLHRRGVSQQASASPAQRR